MMEKLKTVGYGFAGSVATVGMSAMPALAESTSWYEGISVDTTAVTTIFGSIAGALATIWGIRKVIGLINKS